MDFSEKPDFSEIGFLGNWISQKLDFSEDFVCLLQWARPGTLGVQRVFIMLGLSDGWSIRATPPPPPPQAVVVTIEKLQKNGAEEFLGDQIADPMIAKRWFERTIRVLGNLRVPQEQRGDLAVTLLQDSAYDWWKRKFDELAGFGQDLVPTVEKRCKCFVEGLRPDLSTHLIIAQRSDINALYKNALDLNAALIKKAEFEQAQGASAVPSPLIDPGSTLSYVCMPIPDMPNIPREDLDNPVIVSNPLGHSLRLTHVYHDCPLVVQGKTFPASLIELPHREFDVILGMDWLTANQAVVDCGAHTVRLRAEDGSDVLIRGELLPKAPKFISYLHARRLIRKKCEAFLCTVRDTRQEAPSRGDIPTPTLQQQIASAQSSDDFCIQTIELVSRGEKPDFAVRDEDPVEILAREVRQLRNKTIPLVKVLWRSHTVEEAIWETEESMRTRYPHLFSDSDQDRISRKSDFSEIGFLGSWISQKPESSEIGFLGKWISQKNRISRKSDFSEIGFLGNWISQKLDFSFTPQLFAERVVVFATRRSVRFQRASTFRKGLNETHMGAMSLRPIGTQF
ncbi:unnamed protein product [Cuscuta campestris]|uniref:Retrotransposon gag domain-containing protein n=1 Tax=Cuscuta campestris TaxID=132261 RepID=A0A484NDE3_9ASTE|nr:unnamed protein product [Cuscuta campestris]